VPVDPQHGFKADFAREIDYITHETKPIVFVSVRSVAINELRLAAFVSARNCLSSHCCCPSFCSFPVTRYLQLGGIGAAGVPPPLLNQRKD
jgi:hypothetical protein